MENEYRQNYNKFLFNKLQKQYEGLQPETIQMLYQFELSSFEEMLLFAYQTKKGIEKASVIRQQEPPGWIKSWEKDFQYAEAALIHLADIIHNANLWSEENPTRHKFNVNTAWLYRWDETLYGILIGKAEKKPVKTVEAYRGLYED